MRRTISSRLTLLHKGLFVLTFVSGLLFCVLAPVRYYRHRDGTPGSIFERFFFLLLWAFATSPGLWYAKQLMRVQVDDGSLYVSNYRAEIAIPLAEISEVSEGRLWRYCNATVTIHLRRPSLFGSSILFMPRPRLYWRGEHPAVLELRALCGVIPAKRKESVV